MWGRFFDFDEGVFLFDAGRGVNYHHEFIEFKGNRSEEQLELIRDSAGRERW